MQINKSQFLSLEQLQEQYLKPENTNTKTAGLTSKGFSFQEILEQQAQKSSELRFSKHAANRLSDRNITLTEGQLERLHAGADKAGEKGINESLVLLDDLAFIVNIKNNMVITAMDQNETNENVFTNIDGAVIV